jgi:hypothetical protein
MDARNDQASPARPGGARAIARASTLVAAVTDVDRPRCGSRYALCLRWASSRNRNSTASQQPGRRRSCATKWTALAGLSIGSRRRDRTRLRRAVGRVRVSVGF